MALVMRLLGYSLSTLSILVLYQQSRDLGLVAPLRAMLGFYKSLTDAIAGVLREPMAELLTFLRAIMPVPIELSPDWHHSLVAYTAVFGALATRSVLIRRIGAVWSTVVCLFCGAILGISAGIEFGGASQVFRTSAPPLLLLAIVTGIAAPLNFIAVLTDEETPGRIRLSKEWRRRIPFAWELALLIATPAIAFLGIVAFLAVNAGLRYVGL